MLSLTLQLGPKRGSNLTRRVHFSRTERREGAFHLSPYDPLASRWSDGGSQPTQWVIVWEDERREQVLADATYPVTDAEPDVPADPFLIAEDAGWRAVAPTDQVITNLVKQRRDVERHGFEILGPVDLPLTDADKYALGEIDADPDVDRQPKRPDV